MVRFPGMAGLTVLVLVAAAAAGTDHLINKSTIELCAGIKMAGVTNGMQSINGCRIFSNNMTEGSRTIKPEAGGNPIPVIMIRSRGVSCMINRMAILAILIITTHACDNNRGYQALGKSSLIVMAGIAGGMEGVNL